MRITAQDFVPPIVHRAARAVKRLAPWLDTRPSRLHPFDNLPSSISPKWIIDVGANVGDTVIAALKTFPQANVICFEPVPSTLETLRNNLATYADRVHLVPKALSSRGGTALINITSFHGANSLEPQAAHHRRINPHVHEQRQEEISLVTLDDAATTLPTRYADIVKIDVEGHELAVLEGGPRFFRECVDTIMIEIAFARDASWDEQGFLKIYTLLDSYGFCLVNIYDIWRTPMDQVMIPQMDCVFRHRSRLVSPATADDRRSTRSS